MPKNKAKKSAPGAITACSAFAAVLAAVASSLVSTQIVIGGVALVMLATFNHPEDARGHTLIDAGVCYCHDTREQDPIALARLNNTALHAYQTHERFWYQSFAGQGVHVRRGGQEVRVVIEHLENAARAVGILEHDHQYVCSGKCEFRYIDSINPPRNWKATPGWKYSRWESSFERATSSWLGNTKHNTYPHASQTHTDMDRNNTFADGPEHASETVVDARAVVCLYGTANLLVSVPRGDGGFDVRSHVLHAGQSFM